MRIGLGFFAALCLSASAPPGWFPGAGLLVLPGWMAVYALIDSSKRPKLLAWLVGVAHVLAFSFSLVYEFWLAYPFIGLAGGLYYLLMVPWTRRLQRYVPGALAFGCALCGTTWLRAHLPDILYPHLLVFWPKKFTSQPVRSILIESILPSLFPFP